MLSGCSRDVPQFLGGSAPCDWLANNVQVASGSVFVISFTGNSLSPCMSDGDDGHQSGTAVVDKYRGDVSALVTDAVSAHARVLLVGQPVHADTIPGNEIVAGLNSLSSSLAKGANVTFVDAGAAVENSDGTFAKFLPCLPGETECGRSGATSSRHTIMYLGNPAIGARGLDAAIVTALGGAPRFHKANLIPQTADLLAAEPSSTGGEPSTASTCVAKRRPGRFGGTPATRRV